MSITNFDRVNHLSLADAHRSSSAADAQQREPDMTGTASWRMRCGRVTDVHIPGDGRPGTRRRRCTAPLQGRGRLWLPDDRALAHHREDRGDPPRPDRSYR
jgi:hypothetical protein